MARLISRTPADRLPPISRAGCREEKTSYIRVGAAFPHRKGCGFNIEITEGISVSGQLVALPPRPRAHSPRRVPLSSRFPSPSGGTVAPAGCRSVPTSIRPAGSDTPPAARRHSQVHAPQRPDHDGRAPVRPPPSGGGRPPQSPIDIRSRIGIRVHRRIAVQRATHAREHLVVPPRPIAGGVGSAGREHRAQCPLHSRRQPVGLRWRDQASASSNAAASPSSAIRCRASRPISAAHPRLEAGSGHGESRNPRVGASTRTRTTDVREAPPDVLRRLPACKRIAHRQCLYHLTVLHVFAVQRCASAVQRGAHDERVPYGKVVKPMQIDRRRHVRYRQRYHVKPGVRGHIVPRRFARHGQFAGRRREELLEHLD